MKAMTAQAIRIWVTIFISICVSILVAVNLIPTHSMYGAFVITIYVFLPLLLIQLIVLIGVYLKENRNKLMRKSFWVSLLIMLVFIYFLYDFSS